MLLTLPAHSRRLCTLLGFAISFAFASRARAEERAPPSKQACVDAYVSGQRSRKAGKLLDARRGFALCGQTECPTQYASDCRRWRDEVDASIPGVVFDVRDRHGAAAIAVRVQMDGEELVSSLDGRAVAIDPGPHTFVFEMRGDAPRQVRTTVLEGAKAQRIEVTVAPPEPAKPTPAPVVESPNPVAAAHPVPLGVWIAGGVAAAGLGVFTAFGLHANAKESELRSRCSIFQLCSNAEAESGKDSIRTLQIVADVGLGVAVIALGTAVWLYLTRPELTAPKTATVIPRIDVGHNSNGSGEWAMRTSWSF
jgi:hypothetical protein